MTNPNQNFVAAGLNEAELLRAQTEWRIANYIPAVFRAERQARFKAMPFRKRGRLIAMGYRP
jgi:hypothetical protein